MIRTMRHLILAVSLLCAAASAAGARTERKTGYTYEQAWPTAVRHLRVDEGFKIVDKDQDTGYVVFELKDDGKVFAGALEVVEHEEHGRKVVKLVMTITDRPDYMEAQVLDRMLMKLRQEHGDPPRPTPPSKKKPAPEKPAPAKPKK
jgi:DNA-binding transcriptional ArsR family regulator